MANLQSTNVTGTLCVNGVAIGGGKDYKYACFTASDTWTPSSDLTTGNAAVESVVIAGGGGGGASALCMPSNCYSCWGFFIGGTGGGGEVVHRTANITSTDACTITIGAGGQSGSVSGQTLTADAAKGGNSSAVGYEAFGGGGGGGGFCESCNIGGTTDTSNANREGGPSGGNYSGGRGQGALCLFNNNCHSSYGDNWNPSIYYASNTSQLNAVTNTLCSYAYATIAPNRSSYCASASWGNLDLPTASAAGIGEAVRSYYFNNDTPMGWHWDNGSPIHGRAGNAIRKDNVSYPTTANLSRRSFYMETGSVAGQCRYGVGGDGSFTSTGNSQHQNCYLSMNCGQNSSGTDGIVVLRWYE